MIVVEIYFKEGCHLCEEAKNIITKVRSDIHFDLREVDITASPGLYETFKEEIPVIFINGRKAFKYRVNESSFRKKLTGSN